MHVEQGEVTRLPSRASEGDTDVPRQSRVVERHFFAGLGVGETVEAPAVSPVTA